MTAHGIFKILSVNRAARLDVCRVNHLGLSGSVRPASSLNTRPQTPRSVQRPWPTGRIPPDNRTTGNRFSERAGRRWSRRPSSARFFFAAHIGRKIRFDLMPLLIA
jgi:hypothetical protein